MISVFISALVARRPQRCDALTELCFADTARHGESRRHLTVARRSLRAVVTTQVVLTIFN
jgi:hypothetical protein